MSRSAFIKTNELSSTNDIRYHHGLITKNRSNETIPIVVKSSSSSPTKTSINRNNLRLKRNLRDRRRATGIRPSDISLASTSTEDSTNEDDDDDAKEENTSTYITDSNESFDLNRTLTPSSPVKPIFTVNLVQSSFDNLSISRTDPSIKTSSSNRNFRPEEFRLHRVEKQTSDDDSSTIKFRQLEESIHTLESILYEKDNIIHDLKNKLNNMTQDLNDAEQEIYKLHQDKLTLIKALTTIQDKDHSIRSNFITRN